jgi:hypothetical protein
MTYPNKSQALKEVWAGLSTEAKAARVRGIAKIKVLDRTGKKYGRLVVLKQSGRNKHGQYLWECQCVCGNKTTVPGHQLTSGRTRSCGCYQREQTSKALTTHGKTRSLEYQLLMHAKNRAIKNNRAFDICVTDIVIPEKCPIFGTTLYRGTRFDNENSPSIDRIKPSEGYVKTNIWVVSRRANTIKSDATLEELKALVTALEIRLA